jgi:4-hydroxy-tetrahydrodipicolinate synthase
VSTFRKGAWAASLTPLNSDASVDLDAYLDHLRWLLDHGCAGVAALGTTGEANSFTVGERLALIRALRESGIPPDRLVVGTGCCAAPDTIALTRAVLDAGYANVLMLPPFYYKNVSEEGVFQSYAQVIESVGDARLRVLIYDFPQMSGVKISIDLLARLATAFKDIVVGVKNSSGDWPAMEAALERIPGFQVFAGTEQFLLATLQAGGPGCISATANVTSAELGALAADWAAGSGEARQQAITRVRLMLQQYPAIPALKEIMAHATGRREWRRLRPPLINLSESDAAKLIEQAGAAGLIDAVRR